MLASPDRGLAERNPQLPGLHLIFDLDRLADGARRQGLSLPDGCAPSYIRFKAGTRCLVGYGPALFRAPPQFYASAFAEGSEKLVKALERKVVHSHRGPGRIVLEDDAVEVCVFPNDDHLRVLIPLADPERRVDILGRLLPGGQWNCGAQPQTLAYKPERRCVVRFTAPDGSVALIKAYEKNGFDSALARARHFCDARLAGARQQLLGVDERRRVLAMSWMPGRSVADELRGPVPTMTHLERAGGYLADLHASECGGLPAWSMDEAGARLHEIVEVLRDLCPEVVTRARQLARRLLESLSNHHGPNGVLHGDFHPRQVLIEGESVSFIDFDEATVGPAALDLGNFISRLHMNVMRQEISESVAGDAAEALLAGYSGKRCPPSPQSVRAFTALALLNVAHEPFRRYRAAWPDEISAVLDSVERVLEAAA